MTEVKINGYRAVFLRCNPEKYMTVGFRPSYKLKITHVNDANKVARWCMVREIYDGSLNGNAGIVDIE